MNKMDVLCETYAKCSISNEENESVDEKEQNYFILSAFTLYLIYNDVGGI